MGSSVTFRVRRRRSSWRNRRLRVVAVLKRTCLRGHGTARTAQSNHSSGFRRRGATCSRVTIPRRFTKTCTTSATALRTTFSRTASSRLPFPFVGVDTAVRLANVTSKLLARNSGPSKFCSRPFISQSAISPLPLLPFDFTLSADAPDPGAVPV